MEHDSDNVRGPGRPPTDGETRTARITSYFKDSEAEAIKTAARAAYQSRGDFMRQAVLAALRTAQGGPAPQAATANGDVR